MADPLLRIKFETGDGKQAAPPTEINIPAGLSAKLSKSIVRELVIKRLDANLDAALKVIGIG